MRRAIVAYVLGVLLPCVGLTVLAAVLFEGELGRRAAEVDGEAGRIAEEVAARVAADLREAARRAEEGSGPVGHSAGGAWLGFAPRSPQDPLAAASPDEARLYRLSMRGGERFEAEGLGGRAADAYAFFLGRIRSASLRVRLRLGVGRALAAVEAPGGFKRPESGASEAPRAEALARPDDGRDGARPSYGRDGGRSTCGAAVAILREVFEEGAGVLTEEGLPVDLLAAEQLEERDPAGWEALAPRVAARLEEVAPILETPVLEALRARIVPGRPALERLVRERRLLEEAVRERPDLRAAPGIVLCEGGVLVSALSSASLADAGQAVGSGPLLELRRAAFEALPPGGGEVEVSVRPAPPASPGRAASCVDEGAPLHGEAERLVRLDPAGAPAAIVRARDPRREERLAALERWRATARWSLAALLLVPLLAGAALARYLQKERRLARLRAELLANVSHELKTPVTSIQMFAELLADEPTAGEAGRYARQVQSESRRLAQLFEGILEVTRPQGRAAELAREPIDLGELLRRVAAGCGARAEQEGVALALDALPADEAIVEGDAAAIERILWCLLDNALKYRREAGARVSLALAMDGRWARVTVSDNGPGVPRGEEERIFEEFYRVRYDDYRVRGAGLGLAIARRLARRLGGDVELERARGEGATFTLRLPRASGEAS